MSRNRAPLWVLGLFLAQMLFVGVHTLEHVELAHDCTHHDSSSFDGAGEKEHELDAHLDCLYCNLASSHVATLRSSTLAAAEHQASGLAGMSQLPMHCAVWLSAHPLRGPPVFV